MRHASRVPSNIEPNELSEIVSEKEKNAEGFLNLTVSHLDSTYRPDARGSFSARQAVATHWRAKNRIDPEHLFLTSSTSEAYSALIKVFCEPHDEVLVPQPSYPLLTHLVEVEGCKAVSYALREAEGWFVDLEDLRRKVTPKTKMLWIVHPNNPTGSYLSLEQMDALVSFARQNDLALVCDEVFFEYALENKKQTSFLDRPVTDVPVFILGGMSKLLGLPQKKLSWILVHADQMVREDISPALLWVLDLYLSVNADVQENCEKIFQEYQARAGQIQNRIEQNHAHLKNKLKGDQNLEYVRNEGGWNAVLQLNTHLDSISFTKVLMQTKQVFVYPGEWFDMPFPSLVVSLLCEPSDFQKGMDAILLQARDQDL